MTTRDFVVKSGLQVRSNVVVGTYSNNVTPILNGMLVSGGVGIGTSTLAETTKFEVQGGNVIIGTTEYGLVFPDGTFQTTAATTTPPGGTTGAVQYNSGTGFAGDSDNFYYDSTSHRLGIGTSGLTSATINVWGTQPAWFNTKSGSNATLIVGNSTVTGTVLGQTANLAYSYLKHKTADNPMISWNSTGVGVNNITNPVNSLDVGGSVLIGGGIGWTGSSAPSNGLAVQGSVGIGTAATSNKLYVYGGNVQIDTESRNFGIIFSDGTYQNTAFNSTSAVTSFSAGTTGLTPNSATTGAITLGGILALANGGTNKNMTPSNGGIVWTDADSMEVLGASATSGNVLLSGGGATPSWGYSYTSSNVPNSLVSRDASGNFSAGTITAGTGITVTSGGITVTGASQINGNLSISGNLVVTGNINTLNSNVLVVSDPIIYVGDGNPANTWDLGIVSSYTSDRYRHTGFLRNQIDGVWTIFDNLITEPTQTINWSQAGLNYGSFKVGNINVAASTSSTSTTTGAIVTAGGVGISGNLWVGKDANINGLTVGIGSGSIATNNALGYQALYSNTSGSGNNATGYQALNKNTTGGNNTADGYQALYSATSAWGNSAHGYQALNATTTGSYNTADGYRALYSNTTGGQNVADGYHALRKNTTGSNNTALGTYSLQELLTGSLNIGLGHNSNGTTTGNVNIGIGAYTLYWNQNGSYNIACGDSAMKQALNPLYNIAIGVESLFQTQTSYSTGVGYRALYGLTTGSVNTAFGNNSGNAITTGSKNVVLGSYTGSTGPISATGNNYVVLSDGDGNVRFYSDPNGNVGIGTTSATVSNRFAVYGGNVQIDSGSNNYGILFSDNTYQKTAFNSSSAVTSFSAGTTGLTPNTATTGAVTLGGTLGLTNGGTNKNLTASNGGIVWTDADSMEVLSASATSGNILLSGGGATPSWGYSYTSSNVPNSVVSRDASGNFAAGNLTATGVTLGQTVDYTITYTSSTALQQTVDSFAIATYRAAEYQISITSGSNYEIVRVTVIHDGVNGNAVEYNNVFTNVTLATWDASVSGSNCNLLVTPVNASTTFKISRKLWVV